tara:strand:- start:156 stop:623 length:468 start_codon:yes stop_codon:yes gene_type:complete
MDKRKKFDYTLFKQNDKLAREVGKAYWKSLDRTAIDNPDRYGPDLVVDGEYYCEMEIKRAWKGKEFKYKTCQIPHRKAKYLDKDKYDKPTHFLILNNEQEYAFYIKGEDVAASPVVEVPNKYVPSGEMFFQVPLNKLKLVELPKNVHQDNNKQDS